MIEIPIGPNLFQFQYNMYWIMSWHGFFSFVAVLVAVTLVARWAPLKGIHPDAIYSIAIWGLIGGIIGARVVHVIDNWNAIYQYAPLDVFAIWKGGIGVWGGILGGFIGGALSALITKHPVGIVADLTAPAMLFVQSIGRIGDIINGEHCAKATDLFFGFSWTHPGTIARVCDAGFDVLPVHPVIAYEIIWNMVALTIVWKLRGRLKTDGMLFALYLALYSVGRFIISFYREDNVWWLGMQEAHFIALLVLLITIPLLAFKARLTDRVEEVPLVVDSRTRAEKRRKQ